MKPLFETYIPRLKVGMFLREYAFELDRNSRQLASGQITRPQLARKTWAFIEDRFGELNWDNLYWNRTFKSAMQLAFRSVTWKLGNIRGFGKAGRDLWAEGLSKALHGEMPRMSLPMAWIVGLSVVTAIESSIITRVSTGKYPWELAESMMDELKNLIFPRISPKDPTQRVSIPTYFRDGYRLGESIPKDYGWSYVKGGASGELSRLFDDWQNKDFVGRPIYDPNDPMYDRVRDKMEHLVPVPFGISSYERAKAGGESSAKATLGAFGFTQAPASVQPTLQNQMREKALKWMHDSGNPKLVEQAKRLATEQNAPGPYSDLHRALRGGNPDGVKQAYENLRKTHTVKQIFTEMKAASHRPFTGSKEAEQEFFRSLDEQGKALYLKTQQERQENYQAWLKFAASQH
jgi:hypothetical protein